MNVLKQLFWVLVVLNFIDVGMTYTILELGGYEANPLMNIFINQFGVITGMIIMKAIPLTLLWGLLEYGVKNITKLKIALLCLPVISYFWLAVYSGRLIIEITS